jgi:hypothetical protein
MAKKHRYIQTDIWNESWFADMPPRAKLVYLYLLTNPSTNNAGVYIKRPQSISFDLGIDEVSQVLQYLQERGEIICAHDWIIIIRHPRFQKWNTSISIAKAIVSELEDVPSEIIQILRDSQYDYPPIKSEEDFHQEKLRLTNAFKDREFRKITRTGKIPTKNSKPSYKTFNEYVPFGDE